MLLEPVHSPSCFCNMSVVLPAQDQSGRNHSWLSFDDDFCFLLWNDGHCLELHHTMTMELLALLPTRNSEEAKATMRNKEQRDTRLNIANLLAT